MLAKELDVESKAILERLKNEGLNVPNHQSTVSLGLAETIREWFAGQGGASGGAVEAAPSIEATKVKPRLRKKKASDSSDTIDDSSLGGSSATAVAEPEESAGASDIDQFDAATAIVAPVTSPMESNDLAEETTVNDVDAVVEPVEARKETKTTTAPATPTSDADENQSPPAPPVTPQRSVPLRPAAQAPGVPAATAGSLAGSLAGPSAVGASTRPTLSSHDRPLRETVTLASKLGTPAPVRRPVQVAPQLQSLEPAKLQGPRVVRIEKADPVPAPRPRRPMEGNTGPSTGFTTARPATGRGVKISEEDDEEKKKAAKKGAASLSARRRGVDGRRGEAMEKLKEFSEQDLRDRSDRLNAAASSRAAIDSHLKKTTARGTHAIAKTGIQKGEPIAIEEPITVKSFSASLGIKSNDIIKALMKNGIFATINQSLDMETAQTLALNWGIELQVAKQASLEDLLMDEFAIRELSDEYKVDLTPRPPVVTILGHVDHGKTSLLDKIRSANVAAGEAGGITQHTAAWMVTLGEGDSKKQVTFIDTPGHQAFTSMRARGANMTDVVVLVVSAAEGVQPQTIESINHAKAAEVPIIVALNKIDRADANPDMVLGQLAQHDLNPVEWGGTTEVIRTSAVTGQGVKELIEILDYQAELLELKANAEVPARGTVIESRVDAGLGSVATVLIQDGTLYVGDVGLSGPGYGRIRSLLDDKFRPIDTAGPSTPIIVSGLDNLPRAGDKFFVVPNVDRARAIAEERTTRSRQDQLAAANRVTHAGNLLETIALGDVQTINLIIKGDVQGSVETLVKTVGGQNTDEVKVRVIHSGVGAITESDVELAMATKTKPTDNRVAIIGFHVVPEDSARTMAEQHHVDIKTYRVIYEIFDDLKKALSGMLSKEVREKHHGFVDIRKVIKAGKAGNVAGCFVTEGHIQRGSQLRLLRDNRVITEGLRIDSLRRIKDDVKEVKAGLECGIKITGYDDIKEGDRLEAYITEEFERTL